MLYGFCGRNIITGYFDKQDKQNISHFTLSIYNLYNVFYKAIDHRKIISSYYRKYFCSKFSIGWFLVVVYCIWILGVSFRNFRSIFLYQIFFSLDIIPGNVGLDVHSGWLLKKVAILFRLIIICGIILLLHYDF